jgi:hypothetical protein
LSRIKEKKTTTKDGSIFIVRNSLEFQNQKVRRCFSPIQQQATAVHKEHAQRRQVQAMMIRAGDRHIDRAADTGKE